MRYFYLTIFLSLLSLHTRADDSALKPFETDGCTLFAEGTRQQPNLWKHCCFEHDLRYWFGGDSADLDFADVQLRQCVKDVAGNFWANLIYKGVREGHNSPVQHRLHWSWGWRPTRLNTPLSTQEKDLIRKDLNELHLDPLYISGFITKYGLN